MSLFTKSLLVSLPQNGDFRLVVASEEGLNGILDMNITGFTLRLESAKEI